MSGFAHDINGREVVYSSNVDFSGGTPPTGKITTNGQMLIGTTIANAGGTNINVGTLTSPDSSVAIGFSTPNITLQVAGGSTVGKTITGNSGGALAPISGNWNIFGLSGSQTSGAGATLTVKSPPFSQVGVSGTSVLNTGEFVTATATRTLPISAGLADGDLFIYVCTTANVLTIQSVGAQKIRLGNSISAAAGTAASTAIGDSITLRFNGTDGFFYTVGVQGNWTIT